MREGVGMSNVASSKLAKNHIIKITVKVTHTYGLKILKT